MRGVLVKDSDPFPGDSALAQAFKALGQQSAKGSKGTTAFVNQLSHLDLATDPGSKQSLWPHFRAHSPFPQPLSNRTAIATQDPGPRLLLPNPSSPGGFILIGLDQEWRVCLPPMG